MRPGGVQGLEDHQDISTALDEAREQGLISDYLVSWRGCRGRLTPRVTVWRRHQCVDIRLGLRSSLLGLVPNAQIVVLDEDAPSRPGARNGTPSNRTAAITVSTTATSDARR